MKFKTYFHQKTTFTMTGRRYLTKYKCKKRANIDNI